MTTRAKIPAGIHSRLFFRPASRKKEASSANAHLIKDFFISSLILYMFEHFSIALVADTLLYLKSCECPPYLYCRLRNKPAVFAKRINIYQFAVDFLYSKNSLS